jgi:hypothetical protein
VSKERWARNESACAIVVTPRAEAKKHSLEEEGSTSRLDCGLENTCPLVRDLLVVSLWGSKDSRWKGRRGVRTSAVHARVYIPTTLGRSSSNVPLLLSLFSVDVSQ